VHGPPVRSRASSVVSRSPVAALLPRSGPLGLTTLPPLPGAEKMSAGRSALNPAARSAGQSNQPGTPGGLGNRPPGSPAICRGLPAP